MRTLPVALLIAAGIAIVPATFAGEAVPPPPLAPPAAATGEAPVLGVVPDPAAGALDAAGVVVKQVETASTAASLGIKPADVLTAINGKPIRTVDDLRTVMAGLRYDDAIKVDIARGKETRTLAGTLKPKLSVEELFKELQRVRGELAMLQTALGMSRKEPSLADVLQQLRDLQERMPAAIAQFKKQYPNGEFSFAVKIDISSDKTAKNPIEIVPPAKPAPAPGTTPGPGAAPGPGITPAPPTGATPTPPTAGAPTPKAEAAPAPKPPAAAPKP